MCATRDSQQVFSVDGFSSANFKQLATRYCHSTLIMLIFKVSGAVYGPSQCCNKDAVRQSLQFPVTESLQTDTKTRIGRDRFNPGNRVKATDQIAYQTSTVRQMI